MRFRAFIIPVVCIFGFGCHRVPDGTTINRDEAMKTSYNFIVAVQVDHTDEAIALMEPEFLQSVGREKAQTLVRSVIDFCGPRTSFDLRRDETGIQFYERGLSKPMRRFIYAGKESDGVCYLFVDVVPGVNGSLRVVKFRSKKTSEPEL